VSLPDGRTQIVSYTVADTAAGYVADVKYEGQASYPDTKQYSAPAPAYSSPAPVYSTTTAAAYTTTAAASTTTTAPAYTPAPAPDKEEGEEKEEAME